LYQCSGLQSKKGMSNEAIAKEVTNMGYRKERIRADSAEPKSLAVVVV
jgi:phage terminase large subunit